MDLKSPQQSIISEAGGGSSAPLTPAWQGSGSRTAWHLFARAVGLFFAGLLLANIAIALFGVTMGLAYSVIDPPLSSFMVQRKLLDHFTIRPVRFVPIKQIPVRVQRMFIRLENSTFYTDPGIDIAAIEHAYRVNEAAGKIVLGGSTITQQLVRTLFLTGNRNYLRKYVEALMSVSLNAVMTKQRQLELYLNSIEWGKGVFGIGAASLYYYGKPLSRLDLDQTIRLAVIITSPLRYSVFTFARNPGMVERYDFLWSIY